MLTFLLVFFIPKFQKLFNEHARPLAVDYPDHHRLQPFGALVWIFCRGRTGAVAFLVRTWFASEKGRRVWEGPGPEAADRGPLVAQFAMARFCRMLGTLIGAGVPLVQGLNVARQVHRQSNSSGRRVAIDRTGAAGRTAGTKPGGMPGLFPGSMLEMVSVAEESGRLDAELVRIANVTEGDLDRQLKTAVALAEPLMLFFIAGFIGIIFIGMLLPVFSLQDYIK